MRDYEVLYILPADLDDTGVQKEAERVTALIKRIGGKPESTNVWGKRKLAYKVGPHLEGNYVLQDFQMETSGIPELESNLKISEQVFRHVVSRRIKPKAAAAPPAPAAPTAAAPAPAETQAKAEAEA